MQMFQCQFLQNILLNNYWLDKWKILDTNRERQRGGKRLAKRALHVAGVIHCFDSLCTYRGRVAFHHAC